MFLSYIVFHLGGSGGAALSDEVSHFFEDIGIPVCCGYSLTETSPAIATSTTNWETRFTGTVGVLLDDVTLQIIDPETMLPLPVDKEGDD